MFNRTNDYTSINEHPISLTDKNSFFEIEVVSASYQDLGNNRKLAVLNSTISLIIPSGLEGIFKKLTTYKIYYELDETNSILFLASINK